MLELTNPAAALQRPGFLTRPLALPVNPWWALWVLAIGASWLLPTHFVPWRAFHSDLLMALALLPAAFWAALQSRDAMPLHASTLAVVLVACTPLLQLAAGMMYFAGDAWIASVYLFGFALALLVGARFEQLAPGRLVNALFFAIGMAAVLSAGLAVYQWLRLSGLGLLAVETTFARGYRPYANLGQPNHLSTLLVWGLVAVWWARVSGKIRGWPALVAAAWLLLGVAATQSRTGWLEVALLAVCAIIFRKPLRSRADAFGFVVLGAWFALLVSAWGALNRALHLDAPLSLAEQLLAGRRPLSWQIFGDALMRRPWSGWGWNQITIAHSSVAADHPALGYAFQSSHNFPLDLVVQLGLPLGGAITLGLAAWLCHKALRVHTAQGCLLLLAVAVLLVHSML